MNVRRLGARDAAAMRDLNALFSKAFDDPDSYPAGEPSEPYLQRLLGDDSVIVLAAGQETVIGGLVERDGEIIPASYMNFYIGNAVVVVPQYGAPNDRAAVEVVQALFPDRKAVGLRADHLLTGGGSFHCISQQVPR